MTQHDAEGAERGQCLAPAQKDAEVVAARRAPRPVEDREEDGAGDDGIGADAGGGDAGSLPHRGQGGAKVFEKRGKREQQGRTGGKNVILPPGCTCGVTEGSTAVRTTTCGTWVVFRSFLVDGRTEPGVPGVKDNLRIYLLAE